MHDKLRKILGALGIAFFCAIVWPYVFQFNSRPQVIFFNVGQGDAAFFSSPGKTLLVDGGPDNIVLYKLGTYLPWWRRSIDTIVVSHGHADHTMGLLEVLDRFSVRKVIMPDALYHTPENKKLAEMLQKKNIEVEYITSKKQDAFDKGVQLEFFHPEKSYATHTEKNPNNTSILFKLTFASSAVLFTGDLEAGAQGENLNEDLASDILKFPHHGSSDSLNIKFLEKVNPKISVVSVGENFYGHPSLRTLRTLERLGGKVYRTDKDGDVRVLLENEGMMVETGN